MSVGGVSSFPIGPDPAADPALGSSSASGEAPVAPAATEPAPARSVGGGGRPNIATAFPGVLPPDTPEAAYEAVRALPGFQRLPAIARDPLGAVVATAGDRKLAGDLTMLLSTPGLHARLSDLGKLALVDVIAREPGCAGAIAARFDTVRSLLNGADYERLTPPDREKINTCLATHPEAAAAFAKLIALPAFRGLTENEKQVVADRILDAPDGAEAANVIMGELAGRTETARASAKEVKDLLATLDSPVSTGFRSFFRGNGVTTGAEAREKIAAILTGPQGNDVYRMLESEGAGVTHDLAARLVEDAGDPATRERLVRIASSLDPSNTAQLLSNLSHAIGKVLSRPELFEAVASGFSLSAGIMGAALEMRAGRVEAGADALRLAQALAAEGAGAAAGALLGQSPGSALERLAPNVRVGFDPTPLRAVLKERETEAHRALLIETLDSLTKAHELTTSPHRWSDDEKLEYFDAIRRLPGGGGASDIARGVAAPATRPYVPASSYLPPPPPVDPNTVRQPGP